MSPKALQRLVFCVLFASPAYAHDDPLFEQQRQAPFPGPVVIVPGETPPIAFPRQGVSLLAWLPLGEFGSHTSGNDCWGYTSPSGREYALVGLSDGTAVVEVTDPGAPVVVAVLPGPQSLWRDIKTYQDHAYAVSEGGGGIQVFDLSQVDQGIVVDKGSVTTGGDTSTHNVAIDEDSGFLYRVGGGSNPIYGLRIYSLAQPDQPLFVGQWNARYVHDAQVVTYTQGPLAGKQIAFCFAEDGAGGGNAGVDVVDVTNKQNPVLLASLKYSNNWFSHQGWLSPDRNWLYVDDELDELQTGAPTTTRVLDVSDPAHPKQVSTYTNGNSSIDHNLYTLPGLVLAANYRSGLRIFDTTQDPAAPVEIGFFDTYPEDDAPAFNGLWSNYPYFPSGTIVGSDLEKGLFVWRLGDPEVTFAFASPPPLPSPDGAVADLELTTSPVVQISAGDVLLHVESSQGISTVALQPLPNGRWRATFPPLPCGEAITYWFTAKTSAGVTWTFPEAAPTFRFGATVSYGETVVLEEDLENDPGWTVGAPGDTATTGIWTRGDPIGTTAQPEHDHTPDPGTDCYFTGQGSPGGSLGENDVDGGKTTLTTGDIDLSAGDARISYWRWYSNATGSNPNEDVFRVEISNDAGATWTTVETVGPSGPETLGGWYLHAFDVSNFVQPTGHVRLRFVAEDAGGGSIVEAAVDDLRVDRYDCQPSCQTDLGFQGPGTMTLSLCGPALASGRHAVLSLDQAPPSTPVLLLAGTTKNPTPFLAGTLVPVPILLAVSMPTDANGSVQVLVPGGGGPATIYLQAVAPDPNVPLGVAVSNALEVLLLD